jgi:hypothetical protein
MYIWDEGLIVKTIRTIPRGPSEWGDLLWQEPWADKKRKGKDGWWLRVFPYALLTVLAGFGIVGGIWSEASEDWVFIFIITFPIFIIILLLAIIEYYYRLPNRVYEKGFTFYPDLLLWYKRTEGEFFILFDTVRCITIEKTKYKSADVFTIRIDLVNNNKIIRELNLSSIVDFPTYIDIIRNQNQHFRIEGFDQIPSYNPLKLSDN